MIAVPIVLVGLGALVLAGQSAARRRWQRDTAAALTHLRASVRSPAPDASAAGRPAPVARYLGLALPPEHPTIVGARLEQRGTFRIGEKADGWRPFTATQTFSAAPPGFVWDARFEMAPGCPVLVRDSYLGGRGAMSGALFGVIPVVQAAPAPELDAGSLHRFLGELVWMPSRLQPGDGLQWDALDDRHARVTLCDGAARVSLDVTFADDGSISRIYTPDRARAIKGGFDTRGWGCDLCDWERHDGFWVPMAGEVFWELDGRRVPYWRGRIVRVEFEVAEGHGTRAS